LSYYVGGAGNVSSLIGQWTSLKSTWINDGAYRFASNKPTSFFELQHTLTSNSDLGKALLTRPGLPNIKDLLPKDPCSAFSKTMKNHTTPCGDVSLPIDISIPPPQHNLQAWSCLEQRISKAI